ncbi:FHA domain-containing protein [Planctomicrobium sp. SH527]|uniref:FHA domain-containing protein n=1 Tax=Planctomicrobium sp. SH527 TaxID=3448123 RepID=UPI003F5BE85E
MAQLTFQVVEGIEAGRTFHDVSTPLTVGREEDNDIQLNDERVSRFHIKVQEDSGRLILTDLDSTNGTRVNGHPVRLRVLQLGDLIMVGRSVLLVGGPAELKKLTKRLQDAANSQRGTDGGSSGEKFSPPIDASEFHDAFPNGRPPVPSQLSAPQTAELVGILDFIRTEILESLSVPTEEIRNNEGDFIRVERSAWLKFESLAPEISRMINELTNS